MNRNRLRWSAAVCALAGIAFWFGSAFADDKEEKVVTEVPVHVGKITRATLHAYVSAYGMVEPEPASVGKAAASARLASPIAGVVAEANCVEGQRVEKGAVLFRLDARVADVAVERAKAVVEFAEKSLARQKKLLEIEGTSLKLLQESEQQLNAARNELAAAQAQRALLTITAPLAGTVVRVNAKPGEAVDLTTVLAELIDLERLVVTANIPSVDLAALKVGQLVELSAGRASAHSSASSGITNATLSFIGAQVDPKTDTALVRITVPANAGLRPGQFVSVRIVSDERRDRLAVSVESVVKTDDGIAIAIVEGDKATQRRVKVGLRDGGLVEIDGDGLKEGMAVVTKGAYGLPKETKIRVLAQ
jgi:membrane fusion protein (multidrug efflux system)